MLVTLLLTIFLSTLASAVSPEDCEDSEFHLDRDADDCPKSYYRCSPDGNGGWNIEHNTCPGTTVWDPSNQMCNWPDQVPGDICDDPPPPPPHGDKKMICYFGAWAFYRPGKGKFDIPDIDPFVCTHINYGFADMDNVTWSVVAYDPWYDLAPNDEGCDRDHCHYDSYRRFTGLKKKNPELKAFLSIGGWNSGSGKYSMMAADPSKRSTFIKSVVPYAKKYGFDGIDFDWEYPGQREGSDPAHDKEDFTILVQEMAAALHDAGLEFTAAFSPDPVKASGAYDVPAVIKEFDWINIMTYDYHGAWEKYVV
jgi:chitinase